MTRIKAGKKFNHRKNMRVGEAIKQLFDLNRQNKIILVNMQLRNGDHDYFFVDAIGSKEFTYKGDTYIINDNLKYYVSTCRLFALDYHQDYSAPIKRTIDVEKMRKAVQIAYDDYKNDGIIMATYPSLITSYIKSKIIEGVFRGQSMEDFFKLLRFLLFVISIITLITLGLEIHQSGILQGII